MKAPANNHCTFVGNAYAQFDCNTLVDPSVMVLLINGPYRDLTRTWGEARLVGQKITGSLLLRTELLWTIPRSPLNMSTRRSLFCTNGQRRGNHFWHTYPRHGLHVLFVQNTNVYFVSKEVLMSTRNSLGPQEISSTYYRYMKAPAHSLCTFTADSLEFDC